jgi:hypothetical protein
MLREAIGLPDDEYFRPLAGGEEDLVCARALDSAFEAHHNGVLSFPMQTVVALTS